MYINIFIDTISAYEESDNSKILHLLLRLTFVIGNQQHIRVMRVAGDSVYQAVFPRTVSKHTRSTAASYC